MESFIARQPILDRRLKVVGYELLYRNSLENCFPGTDTDMASSKVVVDSLFVAGIDNLTGGRPAWVNLSREMLVNQRFRLIPPEKAILEVLETVEVDADLLQVCREARAAGYRIAVDDYLPDQQRDDLLPLADIVKVDVLGMSEAVLRATAQKLRALEVQLLAEKVETRDVFDRTRELGFGMFQGYFFARPTVHVWKDIPASKLTFFRILQEIHKPKLNLDAVEELISREMAVSYKLLRYVRSAHFGWRGTVSTIRHALMLLGIEEFRNWASVVALAGLANDKPEELIKVAVIRARLCRLIGEASGLASRATDLFTLGLFSLLDAILDRPMEAILDEIALDGSVMDALLGRPGPMRDALDLVLEYVAGNWDQIGTTAGRLNLRAEAIPVLYTAAVQWADRGGEDADEEPGTQAA